MCGTNVTVCICVCVCVCEREREIVFFCNIKSVAPMNIFLPVVGNQISIVLFYIAY